MQERKLIFCSVLIQEEKLECIFSVDDINQENVPGTDALNMSQNGQILHIGINLYPVRKFYALSCTLSQNLPKEHIEGIITHTNLGWLLNNKEY